MRQQQQQQRICLLHGHDGYSRSAAAAAVSSKRSTGTATTAVLVRTVVTLNRFTSHSYHTHSVTCGHGYVRSSIVSQIEANSLLTQRTVDSSRQVELSTQRSSHAFAVAKLPHQPRRSGGRWQEALPIALPNHLKVGGYISIPGILKEKIETLPTFALQQCSPLPLKPGTRQDSRKS